MMLRSMMQQNWRVLI